MLAHQRAGMRHTCGLNAAGVRRLLRPARAPKVVSKPYLELSASLDDTL